MFSNTAVTHDNEIDAVYVEQKVPSYRGNPFLEALPPILESDEAIVAMENLVTVTQAERDASAATRMHMLGAIDNFIQPLTPNVELYHRVSMLMRSGYERRNPLDPKFLASMETYLEILERTAKGRPSPRRSRQLASGPGLTLLGESGVGKSTAIDAILNCYPQVVDHTRLDGQIRSVRQVAWLKLKCPHDGLLKGLCIDFFEAMDEALGTDYYSDYVKSGATVDKLRVGMARVAFIHGLGLLVIDEVQHLRIAKSGGDEIALNYFKLLADVMMIPVLTIGTHDAQRLLRGNFQTARRHSGIPELEPMRLDGEFPFFVESLFDAQYLRSPVTPDEAMTCELFNLSQGIADVLVKLFKETQRRALSIGQEQLSIELFRAVYQDSFKPLHPYLEQMRRRQAPTDKPTPERLRTAATVGVAQGAAHQVSEDAQISKKAVGGVPKRRIKRDKLESKCELVQVFREALRTDVDPHDALLDHGFIRQLGAEAIAA